MKLSISAYDIAARFVGLRESPGAAFNPALLAMLSLDANWPKDDSVPWCSAFANYVAWLLRLPRSKSLRARSWLLVGQPITLDRAEVGFDVVILNRGGVMDPGVIDAPGHVGWFAGLEGDQVIVLGGNQGDAVSLARFKVGQVLGVRRLAG